MSRRVEIALATLLGGFFGFVACLVTIQIQQGPTPVHSHLRGRLEDARESLTEDLATSVVERVQIEPVLGRSATTFDVPAAMAGAYARLLHDAWTFPGRDQKPLPPTYVVTIYLRHPGRGLVLRSLSLQYGRIALGWSGVPWSPTRTNVPFTVASLCDLLGRPDAPEHSAYVAGGWVQEVRRELASVRAGDRAAVEALLASAEAWIASHPDATAATAPTAPAPIR